jgi:hypothetical protein
MYFVLEPKMRQINLVLTIVMFTSSPLNTYGYNLIDYLVLFLFSHNLLVKD